MSAPRVNATAMFIWTVPTGTLNGCAVTGSPGVKNTAGYGEPRVVPTVGIPRMFPGVLNGESRRHRRYWSGPMVIGVRTVSVETKPFAFDAAPFPERYARTPSAFRARGQPSYSAR